MRWTPGGVSDDIEDRRGGGGLGGIGVRGVGLGGGLVLLLLSFIFGQDFLGLLNNAPTAGPTTPTASNSPREAGAEKEVQFVSFVLDDAQRTWDKLLPAAGAQYHHAKLVLFRDVVQSGCGNASAATGPFYCPADEKVYIDLSFMDELRTRFGAPGEFAQAYVLAHEIGHHVQNMLGISEKVTRMQQRNPGAANQLSVRLELQADCLAGVWGHSTAQRALIDQSDVAEGLRAAAAVGDDRLQREARGRVSPETFTHGSSAQRAESFRRGLEAGTVSGCNAL